MEEKGVVRYTAYIDEEERPTLDWQLACSIRSTNRRLNLFIMKFIVVLESLRSKKITRMLNVAFEVFGLLEVLMQRGVPEPATR
jgi:hypothetical protein